MKLQTLRIEIIGTMYGAMKQAIYDGDRVAYGTVDLMDGYIDLFTSKAGDIDVIVSHDDITTLKSRKQSNNIINFCKKILKELRWCDVQKDVDSENTPTPEEEYAHRGEQMFSPALRWHRI